MLDGEPEAAHLAAARDAIAEMDTAIDATEAARCVRNTAIRALSAAGWKDSRIAAELGLSTSLVRLTRRTPPTATRPRVSSSM